MAIQQEVEIGTDVLFRSSGELSVRVRRWPEAMSSNWNEVPPKEPWVAPLFYDVVPAVSGSVIQQVELRAA